MKVRTERKQLADALTWVGGALSKRPISPALAGIRLTAADDRLTIQATDFDLSHTATLDVEVQDDGECLVNGQLLRELVGALKAPDLELVLDDERLLVSAGRSAYRLSTLRLDEYPHLPQFPAEMGELDADDLARAVIAVERSASRDETQGVLIGVLVTGAADSLSLTTTDRYRIARAEVAWQGEDFAAVPQVRSVVAAAKGMSGTVRIGSAGGLFGLSDDRRTVTMRCMEVADFPKVTGPLSSPALDDIEVDAGELGEAVKRAAIASDEYGGLRFRFQPGEVEISATSDTSDGAEYVETTGGLEREVLLTARLVGDALAAAASPRVSLGFTGPPGSVKPVFIRPLDSERVDLLVMPRRQQ